MRFSLNQRLRLKKQPPNVFSLDLPFSALSFKALFAAIPLLLLPYSFNTQALSATTANTIQGTAPYLEFNGVKATDLSSLLSIKIGGDTYVSDATGNMKKVDAGGVLTPVTSITLPNAGDVFSSVATLIPADTTAYGLNNTTVIPASARIDDDGDSTFMITGILQGEWKDKNGNPIPVDGSGKSDLAISPSQCSGLAPYTLTLTATGTPSISTQYGSPNITSYGNSSAVFTINPVFPVICFITPTIPYGTGVYSGPASMWDTTNGFIPQAYTSANYDSNFPTTGANGLYFDLKIAGSTTALTWTTVSVGGITATPVSATATTVRYKLAGPVPTATQIASNVPGTVIKPTLPAEFELEGQLAGTTVVKYGFKLKQWFINRENKSASATGTNSQTAWCSSTGYRISKVMDLTNASGSLLSSPYPSATPASSGNYYQRHIGAGLFSEWGYMNQYFMLTNYFMQHIYWTSDSVGSWQFGVSANDGSVNNYSPISNLYGLCVTP